MNSTVLAVIQGKFPLEHLKQSKVLARTAGGEDMQEATKEKRQTVNLNSDEENDANNGGRGAARAPRREDMEENSRSDDSDDGPLVLSRRSLLSWLHERR